MPALKNKKRKPKVTKARFTHKTKDGTTITGDLDPEDAAARMAEDEDDDEEQEDREYLDSEPQSEAEQVMNAYGAASFTEFRLYRQNPETKQFLFVNTVTAEVAKNPALIAEQEGGGNYQIQIFDSGQLLRTIPIAIDGPPKVKPVSPSTTFVMPAQNGGNSDLASLVQLMIAQGQQQQALIVAVIQGVFNRPKEETKFDEFLKLAQVMGKGDNGSALVKDLFSFMGDSVKTIAGAIGGQPDSPLMYFLQKLSPLAENLVTKMSNRAGAPMVPGIAPPPTGNPAPPTTQPEANGEQQRREYIAMVFQQHLYPQLLRAASERFPDDEWMRKPESIAEALEVEYAQFGDIKKLLLEFLGTEDPNTAKAVLYQRFPDMQRPDLVDWFDEFFECLMDGPVGRRQREMDEEAAATQPPIVIQKEN